MEKRKKKKRWRRSWRTSTFESVHSAHFFFFFMPDMLFIVTLEFNIVWVLRYRQCSQMKFYVLYATQSHVNFNQWVLNYRQYCQKKRNTYVHYTCIHTHNSAFKAYGLSPFAIWYPLDSWLKHINPNYNYILKNLESKF